MSADVNAGVAPLSDCGPVIVSPPTNTSEAPKIEPSDSELSDLEEEDDIGEVTPDHEETGVPVFIPSMDQFKNFKLYMNKVNKYGMKSGIVKVIPPKEWSDSLPPLTEAIKTIRVKEPIAQDIMGTGGTYRQANIVHQRSYNLPQWRQLCDQSDHQPPAKRGERRAHQDRTGRPAPRTRNSSGQATSSAKKKSSGRSLRKASNADVLTDVEESREATSERLLTPVSPSRPEEDLDSVKNECDDEEEMPSRMKGGRQPKLATSISSRRKYNRREAAGKIDEEAFKGFEHRLLGEEYTSERCEELERAYWKTLTYASPLYGADMPGSLFDDRTTTWNLGKLENLLDVLGTKIPGVNTAYLYLGMWKATFAWHLEDVDLYSINYLHFGAPKQWYSISQGDARKFEQVMKSIWPADAKACNQFLRHKTFLISPTTLYQNYGIRANKIVHHPGQFVITFPYGYHSGYNLGYNCAEAVNFALDSWIDYGKIAKRCECDQAQDSVWIDVREIERRLKGEESEVEDSEGEEEDSPPTDLPTPPESSGDSATKGSRKRKRPASNKPKDEESGIKKPRIHMKMKPLMKQPCMLCTTEMPHLALLPAMLNSAEKAKVHRQCATHIPETYIEPDENGDDVAFGASSIHKARLELKCAYCKSKKGGKIQCTSRACVRSYHVTCAPSAGCILESVKTSRIDNDGTEYIVDATLLLCRYHRTQRDKKMDGDALEEDVDTIKKARNVKSGETCQFQYHLGSTFAGRIVENNIAEEMFLVDLLPVGDRVEIAHKWIRLVCESDYDLLPKPSAKAIPMPVSQKAKDTIVFTQRRPNDIPIKGDVFVPGFVHEEFVRITDSEINITCQLKVDLAKEDQMWYYLGESSTEAKAQFTDDPSKRINNPKGHFLSTIPKPIPTSSSSRSYPASYPGAKQNVQNTVKAVSRPSLPVTSSRPEKPYEYKPRGSSGNSYSVDPLAYRSQQSFLQQSVAPLSFSSDPRWRPADGRPIGPYGMYPSPSTQAHQSQTSAMGPPSLTRTIQNAQPLPKPNNLFGNGSLSNQMVVSRQVSSSSKYSPLPESLIKKYPYLAKQFNRDASSYRSPYRQFPPHGFMNGYEGDLKGYLQQNPEKLGVFSNILNQSSSPVINPLLTRGNSLHAFTSSGHQSTKSLPMQGPVSIKSAPQPVSTRQGSNASQFSGWGKKDTSQLHPAIRQDYGMFHHQYGPVSKTTSPPHPIDNTVQREDHPPPHGNQVSGGSPSQHYYSQVTQHQTLSPSDTQTIKTQHGRPQPEQAPSSLLHSHQQLGQNPDKPLHPHQQYLQKSVHSQEQAKPTSQEGLEVSDVPIDSASVVENIVGNLRRHARLLDSSTSNVN